MRASVIVLPLLFAAVASEARAEDLADRRCREFISHFIPVHRVESGTQLNFTGRFKSIPAALETELKQAYPERVFRIAEMEYLHWGFDPVRLLLVLKQGRRVQGVSLIEDPELIAVETYLWSTWFASAPFSFETGFDEDHAESATAAKARITALAKLVALLDDRKVGDVTIVDHVIRAPLISDDGKVERVIRTRVGTRTLGDLEWLKITPPEK